MTFARYRRSRPRAVAAAVMSFALCSATATTITTNVNHAPDREIVDHRVGDTSRYHSYPKLVRDGSEREADEGNIDAMKQLERFYKLVEVTVGAENGDLPSLRAVDDDEDDDYAHVSTRNSKANKKSKKSDKKHKGNKSDKKHKKSDKKHKGAATTTTTGRPTTRPSARPSGSPAAETDRPTAAIIVVVDTKPPTLLHSHSHGHADENTKSDSRDLPFGPTTHPTNRPTYLHSHSHGHVGARPDNDDVTETSAPAEAPVAPTEKPVAGDGDGSVAVASSAPSRTTTTWRPTSASTEIPTPRIQTPTTNTPTLPKVVFGTLSPTANPSSAPTISAETSTPTKMIETSAPSINLTQCVEQIWINEFHYQNRGLDVTEFVEIAYTAGKNLTGHRLVFYDGNTGRSYKEAPLDQDGIISDDSANNGVIFKRVLVFGLNGNDVRTAPAAIAVVDSSNHVPDFVSYGRPFVAEDGPAKGLTCVNTKVEEPEDGAATDSLQLAGIGNKARDFTWRPAAPNTAGRINTDQTITPCDQSTSAPTSVTRSPATTAVPTPVPTADPTAVPTEDPTTSPTDDPTAAPTDDPTRDPTMFFATPDPTRSSSAPPSLSFTTSPTTKSDILTATPTSTPSSLSSTSAGCEDQIWINEFHYQNRFVDASEFVEIARTETLDVTGYRILFYDGDTGAVYREIAMGTPARSDTQNGVTLDAYNAFQFNNEMRNGPDGVAIVDASDAVLDRLAYGGSSFTAVSGPAAGLEFVNVGTEAANAAATVSLQLVGTGHEREDFAWGSAPVTANPGRVNTGQQFTVCSAVVVDPVTATPSATQDTNSVAPTDSFTATPTTNPTNDPTEIYSVTPTTFPSNDPTEISTVTPTRLPTNEPTEISSVTPTTFPTNVPVVPTKNPTPASTENPTETRSTNPSNNSSAVPTKAPTMFPTEGPTDLPSHGPTALPTESPSPTTSLPPPLTSPPTKSPTVTISESPTDAPSKLPTSSPTPLPTKSPTSSPTRTPSESPTSPLTTSPTSSPTKSPSNFPTMSPTKSPTKSPSTPPTTSTTRSPTKIPTTPPTETSSTSPTKYPTTSPTESLSTPPTSSPTQSPTKSPTKSPTESPTRLPSSRPSVQPVASAQCEEDIWINEFHYQNRFVDASEFVEVARTETLDVTGYRILFYDGDTGAVYREIAMGTPARSDTQNGVTLDAYNVFQFNNEMRNGPDGVAIVDASDAVLDRLAYGGSSFTVVSGPAAGLEFVNVGTEAANAAATVSLQLVGTGRKREDFAWRGSTLTANPGRVNTGQEFVTCPT